MNPRQLMAAALDPSLILRARGISVDPWQRDVLLCPDRQILLNCCRQSGKSTTVSAVAVHTALFQPGSLTLIVSPGQRQSGEIFRKVMEAYHALQRPIKTKYSTRFHVEFANGSRIVCLPSREETIRCYSGVNLLIIDEASRVPDVLYRSVRPMLAVSRGRLIALSTPFGQRGWFFAEWHGKGCWKRVKVTWKQCPRITEEFIQEETTSMGLPWVQQEYECLFTALEGLVYPDFERSFVDGPILLAGNAVGGIDWGWRNPFAAVWGILDRDDVLWIQDERYLCETPLHEHAKALPRIMWYADPAGRTEIEEFRVAGHTVRKGFNDIRLGIAAVTARLRTGRLKVHPTRCPNLVAEARRHRYPTVLEHAALGENPIDENNHALGALRYLISRLDSRFIAKLRKAQSPGSAGLPETDASEKPEQPVPRAKSAGNFMNPNLWPPLEG